MDGAVKYFTNTEKKTICQKLLKANLQVFFSTFNVILTLRRLNLGSDYPVRQKDSSGFLICLILTPRNIFCTHDFSFSFAAGKFTNVSLQDFTKTYLYPSSVSDLQGFKLL